SVFQEVYHPESTYLEKASVAQLTRIYAADRLFSVPFTRITKCTGVCRFVRGIPVAIGYRVAGLWGFCGARRSPDLPGLPDTRCLGTATPGGNPASPERSACWS